MPSKKPHYHKLNLDSSLAEVHVRENDRLYLNSRTVQAYSPGNPATATPVTANREPVVERRNLIGQELGECQQLLSAAVDAIHSAEERREQTLLEMQQISLELAVAAASHLVHEAIQRDQFGIEELIRSTIRQVDEGFPLTVTLNPEDQALLNRRLDSIENKQDLEALSIQVDASLPRGTCQVRTSDGRSWRTEMSTRLDQIRKHWLEELDESQVERRQTQETDSSLRRFPDRRETA